MTNGQNYQLLKLDGPPKETLFWEPSFAVVHPKLPALHAYLNKTWEHYKALNDDRLVGLTAALVIESSLDGLLQSIAPGFKASGFTFSMKVKIARSLQLIPARLLTGCYFIADVRNQFAHNVQIKRFEDLPSDINFLPRLAPLLNDFGHSKCDPAQPQVFFKDLVDVTLIALWIYTAQVGSLREYISSDTGRADFLKWATEQPDFKESMAQFNEPTHPPQTRRSQESEDPTF